MADTVTEIPEDMVVDHAKTTHERDHTTAMATRKILASCEDIKHNGIVSFDKSCGGFLEYSISLPFDNRGKRFFDAIFTPR